MEVVIARDITEFEFLVWAHNACELSRGAQAHFCPTRSRISCLPVAKEFRLHRLLHLCDRRFFLSQFVLVMSLFVLQLYDLFVKFVSVALDPISLFFERLDLVFTPAVCILRAFLKCLSSLPLPRQLVLCLPQRHLCLLHLLAHILSEINVGHALLHHKVH